MVILNQIVGIGGFSIAANLRLIVIAAIFIGIIAVLLYLKFARNGEETNGKDISKEEVGEDIEDTEDTEDLEDITVSAEGTGMPVVNSETIEEKIKNSETEIITKFAEVMKDIKAKIDTKLTAETGNIRAEFTTKIEQLISSIEERDKEVANKIESVIKVQEALYEMNDRIGAALHDQKDSTASVLKKLVDSLRTEDASVSSLASEVLSQSPSPLQVEEKELDVSSEGKADIKLEETVSDGNIGDEADFDMQDFLDGEPAGISSSDEPNVAVEEDVAPEIITEGALEVSSEGKADEGLEVEAPAKEPIASLEGNEEKVSEEAVGDAADFDMQEFLDAESETVAVTEGGLEAPSEDKVEAEDQVASSEGIEEKAPEIKAPESAGGATSDFDIQGFLDELENIPSENDSEA